MALDGEQLQTLASVIRCGSFEKAGEQLGITQSAVSQRIRQLEQRTGLVLVVRGQPCRATEAGERLFRHAEEVALMERDLLVDLGRAPLSAWPTLRLAITADSLATWFAEAMAAVDGLLFDVILDDQDHSAEWLRRGEVRAAVSALAEPVHGCDCLPLGALVYRATASPAFARRWFADGVTAESLSRAPCLTFNAKDGLQASWLRQVTGRALQPPTHWLPASQAFLDGARLGLGWGMNPEKLAAPLIASGALIDLRPEAPLAVPLYWHWSRSMSKTLAPVTGAVLKAARATLSFV
ncbi:LysR family transcriptional regulator ArgP [Rhizobium paknamense]|uniref:LysR family transcriptional regulator (Chromosome initiation inhibitor) n=1 Tax=Rhizobium paknamense TaxID=1206817 RepID=A0ABU0IA43_9HYPH|nr:LysR family transcriptional regulator ArgP [Rhizobium paknamense]MDQ0454567.1 LysR family transcriptional regulator (chromosome initiation inhibitor) [Rhizobium paknamense]